MLQADDILRKTISDKNCVYIFPTEIAASAWADRVLEITDAGSVAMNRFIAWDTFKADAIRSQKQNKRSIPAVVRTMFAEELITENARLVTEQKQPLFASLINPLHAQTAHSFSKWIAGLLPSLGLWYEHTAKKQIPENGFSDILTQSLPPSNTQYASSSKTTVSTSDFFDILPANADSEDYDLLTLTVRYSVFLERQQLFEPAWEKPPFKTDGRTYYIFYPEILTDFFEYEHLLASAKDVEIVHTPLQQENAVQQVHCFTNSRAELDAVARRVRELNDTGIPWSGISVSIADIETYAPYLEREFELHSIPYIRRAGKPLADYGAGKFFKTAQECVSTYFSFDSLRQLLLDKNLPWKDEETINQCIAFGKKNNCLCSWKENGVQVDIWEQAFASPTAIGEERARTFYFLLKKELTALVTADSFEQIRGHYFSFREKFFDMERCSPLSDKILGRCISELLELIDIENTYPAVKPANPFAFFVQYIADKEYLPRPETQGVNILPYRAAAAAATDCHIVIGASQKTLSVTIKQLGFLRENKRKQLELADADLSVAFIRLYGMHSTTRNAYFTFAENSFEGYSIPHSALIQTEEDPAQTDTDDRYHKYAAYENELRWFADPDSVQFPRKLYPIQKTGFLNWSTTALQPENTHADIGQQPLYVSSIPQRLFTRSLSTGEEHTEPLFRVSVTDMHSYYTCPIMWLYGRVFELDTYSLDAELTTSNIAGIIYHAVLEQLFIDIKNEPKTAGILASLENNRIPEKYAQSVRLHLNTVLQTIERTGQLEGIAVSIISAQLLRSREKNMREALCNCLRAFLSYFAGYAVSEAEKEYAFIQKEENGLNYILKGRIDLVLIEPETDAPVIIDFKTSKTPKPADCVQIQFQAADSVKTYELTNFQMAMYTKLYELAHPGIIVEKACFFSILNAEPVVITGLITDCNGKKKPYRDNLVVSRESFEPSIQLLHEKTVSYVQNVCSGRPLSAEGVAYKTCAACLYRHICRTHYSVSGRKQEHIII